MCLVPALALVLAPTVSGIADESPQRRAGVAAADITPDKPMWMAGYAARTKPAEGTAQHLFAKAAAFEDAGGTRVVFVTLDLSSVPRSLRDRLEAAARHPRAGESARRGPDTPSAPGCSPRSSWWTVARNRWLAAVRIRCRLNPG